MTRPRTSTTHRRAPPATLEKQLRSLQTAHRLLLLAFGILFVSLLFLLYFQLEAQGMLMDLRQEGPVINLSTLTPSEAAIAQSLLDQLDPLYLKGHKSITFTHNVTQAECDTGAPCDIEEGYILHGFNYRGHIYVQYESVSQMRITLCHEILHTFFKGGDTAHDIVRDLAAKDVCYRPEPPSRTHRSSPPRREARLEANRYTAKTIRCDQ